MEIDEEKLQNERTKKQKLLYNEIIQKNYDSDKFKEFLETKKPDGGNNIDIWNNTELLLLIKEFQIYSQPDEPEIKPTEELEPTINKEIQKNDKKQEQIIVEEEYFNELPSRKLGQTIFSDYENLDVVIKKVEIKSGGIFSSPYANFIICIKKLNFEVGRTFEDFHWLRNNLIKMYPGIMIPPLQNKKQNKNIEELTIKKQKFIFEKFLNDSIRNPFIRDSKIFYDFLSIPEDLHFKVKKKEYKNIVKPEKLEHFYSKDGNLKLVISNEKKNYFHYISYYIYEADIIYTKISKLTKQLLIDFDQLSSTVFSLGESFNNLHKLSNNFNNHTTINNNFLLDNVYVSLNNMMIDWGDSLAKQINIVQENLHFFFKYEKNYNSSLKDIIKERNVTLNDYEKIKSKKENEFKNSKSLIEIKEKLTNFFSKDKTSQMIKDKFSFFNNQVAEELNRCLNEKSLKYVKHFTNFGNLQCSITKDMHIIWADILTHFQEVTSERKYEELKKSENSHRLSFNRKSFDN